MLTEKDVYFAFRRASPKPYRAPKDWDEFFNKKMNKPSREALETITSFFNTKWKNINVAKYMACGFELFPTFTYVKFFDPRIISLYITKDKIDKRECELDKRKIIESAKFVKRKIKDLNLYNLKQYGGHRVDFSSTPIDDYLQGPLDSLILFYLIYKKYLILQDHDEGRISYIMENSYKLKCKILSILEFFKSVEGKINE